MFIQNGESVTTIKTDGAIENDSQNKKYNKQSQSFTKPEGKNFCFVIFSGNDPCVYNENRYDWQL